MSDRMYGLLGFAVIFSPALVWYVVTMTKYVYYIITEDKES